LKTQDKYTKFIVEEDEDFIRKLFIIKKTTSKTAKKQLEWPKTWPLENGSIKLYKSSDVMFDIKGYSFELRESFSYISEEKISLA
jgi:hypothetical protein